MQHHLNGSYLSPIALDTTLSLSKVPLDVLPLGGSAVKLSSSQNTSIIYKKQTESVFNSKIPGVFSPLMKENDPLAGNPFSENLTSFDSPGYDAFFGSLSNPIHMPPSSYDALWKSGPFHSSSSARISPISGPTQIGSSTSIDSLDTSSISSTSSLLHSISPLSYSYSPIPDTPQSPLLSLSHLVSLPDVSMDTMELHSIEASLKWKTPLVYVSAYSPPSTEFGEPGSGQRLCWTWNSKNSQFLRNSTASLITSRH